jgi:hypothetical protein
VHSLKDVFRTAIAVVLFLAIASLLTHNPSNAAPMRSVAPARGYYVTQAGYYGNEARTTACAAGYHMASLWEINDPSNLRYDPVLGTPPPDYGGNGLFTGGPPSGANMLAWIRTGDLSQPSCSTWTSGVGTDDVGTAAVLDVDAGRFIVSSTNRCDTGLKVWCVQD